MKIKFLSIAFAFVLALALASCGSKDDAKDAKPTGDPVKDAKAYVEKTISLLESVNSAEDFEKIQKQGEEMEKEFTDAYKDKPEDLKKFQQESAKLMMSGENLEKIQKLQEKISKFQQ